MRKHQRRESSINDGGAMFGMTRSWRRLGWKLALVNSVMVGGAIPFGIAMPRFAHHAPQTLHASLGDSASAQIKPDGTLPNNSIVTPSGNTSRISGGTQKGSNLFHSFEEFSVPTGGAAYFNNALNIQNIISRVTGGSISNINGLISARGTANLFLLNPNGIIFGPNAALNIGGSILASTASAVKFADGTQFNATAHPTTPLLTVSVPIGLQYGGTAGSIVNQSQATNSSGVPVGLAVQTGKTLALLGGDVRMSGGNLQAPGGRVELGGVSGAGTVGLSVDGNNLGLSFPVVGQLGDVSLTNGASVNVRSGGGGSIAINALNFNMAGGSGLLGGIASGMGSFESIAGDIEINATRAIKLTDDNSLISNSVQSGAIGNGGGINIQTGSLSVRDGAHLETRTFGQGNAGSVTIKASDTVYLAGFDGNVQPTVGSDVVGDSQAAVGNGNNINITARSVVLEDEAIVAASILYGRGENGRAAQAGDVIITASDTVSLNNSRIYSEVGSGSVGNGGTINITAPSVALDNNAFLNTQIRAGGKGNGGDINITTGSLALTNGGGLSASSKGNGAAGNLEVSASSIRLSNQATLSAETTAGQGNIFLDSQDLVLRRESFITTNATGTATGGNITIDTDILVALENSDISANAQDARGGQITIDAQGIFGTEFRERKNPATSDITVTSELGPEFSGIVEINTLDVDPSLGVVELPSEVVDPTQLIANSCIAPSSGQRGSFIITGSGGLPTLPDDPSNSPFQTYTVPSRLADDAYVRPPVPWELGDPIVEVQGIYRLEDGRVVLGRECPRTGR